MIIYEAHVRGLTMANPNVAERHRGKFLGVCDDWMISHMKSLGVDAIQLMPIFDSHGTYWGYDPVSWFDLNPRYGTLNDFLFMRAKLQDNGIKVILDVVYNHTHGKMDGVSYYDWDVSGCGNTVDVKHSLSMIMDSMHLWLSLHHVDGMRFDLANIMGREGGNFNPEATFFSQVETWFPHKILIAEPWDCAEYSLGRYPEHWLELNGQFRDVVRGGSSYTHNILPPERSVDFITCHDGFTMWDLVSYNEKHNWANGEDNQDGCDNNQSYNHGVEGITTDISILKSRWDHVEWMKSELMNSPGHKLILAGDEVLNTQFGNNNTYCQDNEVGWVTW